MSGEPCVVRTNVYMGYFPSVEPEPGKEYALKTKEPGWGRWNYHEFNRARCRRQVSRAEGSDAWEFDLLDEAGNTTGTRAVRIADGVWGEWESSLARVAAKQAADAAWESAKAASETAVLEAFEPWRDRMMESRLARDGNAVASIEGARIVYDSTATAREGKPAGSLAQPPDAHTVTLTMPLATFRRLVVALCGDEMGNPLAERQT